MYGLPQPAAERGRAEDPPVYLPASENKKSAYNIYTKTVTQYSPVHYRSFCHILEETGSTHQSDEAKDRRMHTV